MNAVIALLEKWNDFILGDWLGDWWPLRHWPESPGFVISAFAMMVITGMFPLDIPPKRYVHYGTGVVAIACFFIMGPRVIWVLMAAVSVRAVIYYTVWPRSWRQWKFQRIANHPVSIAWAVAGYLAGVGLAHRYYQAVGPGTYPVPTGTLERDFKYALMLVVMDLSYAAVSETGVWFRNRNRPPEPDPLRTRGIMNNDLTLYFVIAILAAPVNFAALESYRDRYPLTTIAWFLWGFYVSIAIQMLIQRREKIIRLLGELELKSRLAAVGEVSARIAHQTRHELGLAGMSLHQIEKQLGPLPPENREAVLRELDKLGQVREDLSRMLTGVLKMPDGVAPEAAPMKSYAAIARDEAEHIRSRAVSAGIKIDVHVDGSACEIRSPKDAEKFSQALFNLIDNAVAAARRQVVVTVANGAPGIVLTVDDDGAGVAAEQLGQIIKPFYSTKPDGTGMGLSVAKAVVEEEGGSLRLSNRPEGGLRATLTIA